MVGLGDGRLIWVLMELVHLMDCMMDGMCSFVHSFFFFFVRDVVPLLFFCHGNTYRLTVHVGVRKYRAAGRLGNVRVCRISVLVGWF